MKRIFIAHIKVTLILWGVNLFCFYVIRDFGIILFFVYMLGLPIILLKISEIISKEQGKFYWYFNLVSCLLFQTIIAYSPLTRIADSIENYKPIKFDNESWIWFSQSLLVSFVIIIFGWLWQMFTNKSEPSRR